MLPMGTNPEPWVRRHALHLASQLPDDPEDALAVLAYARELVEFMSRDHQPTRATPVLVPFSADSASAKRRAKS